VSLGSVSSETLVATAHGHSLATGLHGATAHGHSLTTEIHSATAQAIV
jgi:methyl coenzyme M reductase gamma subunit